MPLLGSLEVESGEIWGYFAGGFRSIYDTFNRAATSGTLGVSTSGQLWTTLAGNWYVNSSHQAETDSVVSSGVGPYPLASYDLAGTNQLAYANVSPGMGVAFNIKDANNWYAVVSYDYETSYLYNCSTCYTCCSCSICTGGYGYNCGICGITPYSICANPGDCPPVAFCPGGFTQGAIGGQCGPTQGLCTYYECCADCCLQVTNYTNDCTNCGQTCNPYSCNCSTGYNYYYYLTVLQSINGTVSTVSTVALSQDPASISVQLKNNTVNYYAYSTNISGVISQPYGLGTVLISGSFAISGTIGTQIGMVKSPSYNIQGATISGFYGTGI